VALTLRPASAVYTEQSCDRDDYAVIQNGKAVGRIVKVSLAGSEHRWTWSFKTGTGVDDYEMGHTTSREDAMAAFRRAWHAAQRTSFHRNTFKGFLGALSG
jgi:hypothetical protein